MKNEETKNVANIFQNYAHCHAKFTNRNGPALPIALSISLRQGLSSICQATRRKVTDVNDN